MQPRSRIPPKIFETNFTISWTPTPSCVNCSQEFTTKGFLRSTLDRSNNASCPKNVRRPMLFDCGHNICEHCVFVIAKKSQKIDCSACKKQFPKTMPIRESYEHNYHLLGQIMYRDSSLDKDFELRPATINENTEDCIECNTKCATFCEQCNVSYCHECFDKVHAVGKALKKHYLSPLQKEKKLNLVRNTKCHKHNRVQEFYCVDCKRIICGSCTISNHEGHKFTTVSSENEKYASKVQSLIEMVDNAIKMNQSAIKKTKFMEKQFSEFGAQAVKDVVNFFLELHQYLQLLERNTVLRIKDYISNPLNQLQTAMKSFVETKKTLENVSTTLENISINPPIDSLLSKTIESVNTLLDNMPLLAEYSNPEFKKPFNILSNDLKSRIESSFEIVFNPTDFQMSIRTFAGELLKSSKEPERNKFEDLSESSPSISDTFNLKFRKRIMVEPDDSFIRPTLGTSCVSEIRHSSTHFINLQKVHISHIDTPALFYVQKEEFFKSFESLQAEWNDAADHAICPKHISIGGIFLVRRPKERSWYRGQVVSMVSVDTNEVFLVDVGTTLNISRQNIRQIPDSMKRQTFGAIKCRIQGIKPRDGSWTSDLNHIISDIVDNEIVNAVFMNEDDVAAVELITTHRKYAVCIRDALLFLGVVVKNTNDQFNEKNALLKNVKSKLIGKINGTMYKVAYKAGRSIRVEIVNVIHPQEFYALCEDDVPTFTQLTKDLEEYFQTSTTEHIYFPQRNMPCAVFSKASVYRAVVEERLSDGKLKVFYCDRGEYEVVSYKNIRVLPEQFLCIKQLVFECCLADIETKQDNNYKWTEAAIEDFTRAVQNPNIRIDVTECKQFRHKVYLLLVKRSMDVNVNALMVRHNHADSTSTESMKVQFPKNSLTDDGLLPHEVALREQPQATASDKPRRCQSQNMTEITRSPIKVLHMESPGEFYIQLKSHVAGVERLHRNLQAAQALNNDNAVSGRQVWAVGDFCIVLTNLNGGETGTWYRARLMKCIDDLFTVFLVDEGRSVRNVAVDQLASVPPAFANIADSALKCHMACVEPTGGLSQWSCSAIDKFENMIKKYDSLSASIQGKRIQRSIPVIVWSLLTECAGPLEPNILKWINLNSMLVNAGLAHLKEKFETSEHNEVRLEDEFKEGKVNINEWLKGIDEAQISEPEMDNFNLADELLIGDNVIEYLQIVPIGKSMFTGYPTYVDIDGTVYLHDSASHQLLDNMRTNINSKFINSQPDAHEVSWLGGQICLARFHVDKKFYRAIVINQIDETNVEVKFVDYGNIEECKIEDLRNVAAYPNIPAQANTIRIHGIRPLSGESKFTTKALDAMHSAIVGKLCSVKIVDDQKHKEIPLASIHFDQYDLAEYLIVNKFVGYDESIPAFRRFLRCSLDDNIEDFFGDIPKKNETLPKAEVFKDMFEKMEFSALYKGFNDDEKDVVELECSINSDYWKQVNESVSDKDDDSITSFNPKETSSLISCSIIPQKFKSLDLPYNVNSFYCSVTYINSPTHLFISPFINDHQKKLQEMMTRIQLLAKSSPSLKTFQPNTPCIAVYKSDGKWYRAIIRSYSAEKSEIQVVYVDYLNAEKIDVNLVRKCPPSIMEVPLKNIQVSLHGVRPNMRMRNLDIQKKLSELLPGNQKVFARIFPGGEKFPRVRLYENQSEKDITIYDSLIANRYYTVTKE